MKYILKQDFLDDIIDIEVYHYTKKGDTTEFADKIDITKVYDDYSIEFKDKDGGLLTIKPGQILIKDSEGYFDVADENYLDNCIPINNPQYIATLAL